MEYSAESVRYLHIAYGIFLVVQVVYVGWLVTRWNRVEAATRLLQHDRRHDARLNG